MHWDSIAHNSPVGNTDPLMNIISYSNYNYYYANRKLILMQLMEMLRSFKEFNMYDIIIMYFIHGYLNLYNYYHLPG